MLRLAFLILIGLGLGPVAEADVGFLPTASTKLSEYPDVQRATKAVYRLYLCFPQPRMLAPKEFETQLEQIKEDPIRYDWAESARKAAGLRGSSKIPWEIDRSASGAFLSDSRFLTAMHVVLELEPVKAFLKSLNQTASMKSRWDRLALFLKRTRFKAYILDGEGEIVFGEGPGDFLTLDYLLNRNLANDLLREQGKDPLSNDLLSSLYPIALDGVTFTLSRTVNVVSVPLASRALPDGALGFAVGFPRLTRNRVELTSDVKITPVFDGNGDSDGRSRYLSVGVKQPALKLLERLQIRFPFEENEPGRQQTAMLISAFSADTQVGQSGGPVFNSQGEVVSLVSGAIGDSGTNPMMAGPSQTSLKWAINSVAEAFTLRMESVIPRPE